MTYKYSSQFILCFIFAIASMTSIYGYSNTILVTKNKGNPLYEHGIPLRSNILHYGGGSGEFILYRETQGKSSKISDIAFYDLGKVTSFDERAKPIIMQLKKLLTEGFQGGNNGGADIQKNVDIKRFSSTFKKFRTIIEFIFPGIADSALTIPTEHRLLFEPHSVGQKWYTGLLTQTNTFKLFIIFYLGEDVYGVLDEEALFFTDRSELHRLWEVALIKQDSHTSRDAGLIDLASIFEIVEKEPSTNASSVMDNIPLLFFSLGVSVSAGFITLYKLYDHFSGRFNSDSDIAAQPKRRMRKQRRDSKPASHSRDSEDFTKGPEDTLTESTAFTASPLNGKMIEVLPKPPEKKQLEDKNAKLASPKEEQEIVKALKEAIRPTKGNKRKQDKQLVQALLDQLSALGTQNASNLRNAIRLDAVLLNKVKDLDLDAVLLNKVKDLENKRKSVPDEFKDNQHLPKLRKIIKNL